MSTSTPALPSWRERAAGRVGLVVEAAGRLEQDLEYRRADRATSSATPGTAPATAAADDLADEIAHQLAWLREDPCPDVIAGVELRAALHVYRNASFAYRRLASLSPGSDTGTGIATTCSSLLTQAAHHLDAFRHQMAQGP